MTFRKVVVLKPCSTNLVPSQDIWAIWRRRLSDELSKIRNAKRRAREIGNRIGQSTGFKAGYHDGFKIASESFSEKVIGNIERERDIQEQILDASMMLAEKIIGNVSVSTSDVLRENIERIKPLVHATSYRILRINPRERKLINSILKDLKWITNVETSEAIEPGCAKIIIPDGEFSINPFEQLRSLGESIRRKLGNE